MVSGCSDCVVWLGEHSRETAHELVFVDDLAALVEDALFDPVDG